MVFLVLTILTYLESKGEALELGGFPVKSHTLISACTKLIDFKLFWYPVESHFVYLTESQKLWCQNSVQYKAYSLMARQERIVLIVKPV